MSWAKFTSAKSASAHAEEMGAKAKSKGGPMLHKQAAVAHAAAAAAFQKSAKTLPAPGLAEAHAATHLKKAAYHKGAAAKAKESTK